MSVGILCLDDSPQTTQVLALVFRGVLGSSVEKNGLEMSLSKEANTSTHKALTRSSANPNSNITDLEGSRVHSQVESKLGDVYV